MVLPAKKLKFILLLPLLLAIGHAASAQNQTSPGSVQQNQQLSPDPEEFCRKTGDNILDEMRIKTCIKQQEKDFQELLSTGEEAVKLSADLEKAFDKTSALATDDQKKLERLEKLFKKIRSSLGGEDDDGDADDNKPMTLKAAFGSLSEKAANLLSELKKSTRYSVSAVAIQSSNAIIRLVKFIRFNKN